MDRQTRALLQGSTVSRRNLYGFTLIELLVVITIIGMLMALLLPAVQAARESGRRATCISNQKNLSLAMLTFESSKKCFPGYKNTVGPNTTSWVVPLLPHLDRKDLYDYWVTTTVLNNNNFQGYKYIKLLICPSDPPDAPGAGDTSLSYVVNVGRNDTNTNTYTNTSNMPEGVCFDQVASPLVRVGIDYISSHDGASTTLLLAESVLINPTSTSLKLTSPYTAASGRPYPKWLSPNNPPTGVTPIPPIDVGFNWYWPSGVTPKVTDKILSRHGGGIVVSFCDGHQSFLRNEVDCVGTSTTPSSAGVFQHLMTPWGAGCTPPLTGILDEGSF